MCDADFGGDKRPVQDKSPTERQLREAASEQARACGAYDPGAGKLGGVLRPDQLLNRHGAGEALRRLEACRLRASETAEKALIRKGDLIVLIERLHRERLLADVVDEYLRLTRD